MFAIINEQSSRFCGIALCVFVVLCACLAFGEDNNHARVYDQYASRVDGLIRHVRDEEAVRNHPQSIADAILELGRHRVERAIPVLIERLDFRIKGTVLVTQSRKELFPSIKALEDMGPHALPFLADALAQMEKNDVFRENARLAIVYITGDLKKANTYIRGRIKLYDTGRKRLEAAIVEQ